ncbi:hypothetical protein EB796_004004 [Bugula neritina]|uniref:Uncharacterized protein n=1 Tax=Bugula neritina TaxID=10212 RepID=A0A7J7KHE1_BUGNE|nr:hypothetical protein EB796_004004 [Bugula neritina]
MSQCYRADRLSLNYGFSPACCALRSLLCTSKLTQSTIVWLLPTVCPEVFLQVTAGCTSKLTQSTIVWLLPTVCPEVFFRLLLVALLYSHRVHLYFFLLSPSATTKYYEDSCNNMYYSSEKAEHKVITRIKCFS